ncbi:hypothetical protein [Deinococcus sp.]|uniref:hypothetical protein n=1 Tax=Deinococcus sp. TaxID=47478 RepID=UPI0025D5DB49|nr:hypothetical protein [Deinococcus sp.]
MKYAVQIDHELLSGYFVWEIADVNFVATENATLLVFENIGLASEHFQGESIEPSEIIIDSCILELSRCLHKVDKTAKNHFLDVHNILDDVAINLDVTFEFSQQDRVLDLLNDYDEFGVDGERLGLLFALVENINLMVLRLSKSYILIENG